MITLAYPWLLLALALPLALRLLLTPYKEPREGLRIPFIKRLERASGQTATRGVAPPSRTKWQRFFLIPACWVLVVIALARPQWVGEAQTTNIPSRDLLLAVDLSGSMETQDFTTSDGKKTDRLTAVKEVVDEFIAAREGDRVGLLVFGTAAFIQTTFTEDLEAVQTLLAETRVGMAGPNTVIGDAIGLSLTVFQKSELEEKVLILLTDGNDTRSLIPPTNAARLAADEGVIIHTIAVGDPRAAGEDSIDEKTLKEISSISSGAFFRADDREQLAEIYKKINAMETMDNEVVTHRPVTDLFHWLIGAVVVLTLGSNLTSALLTKISTSKNALPKEAPEPEPAKT